jgi:four helix bundle protein
MAIRSFRDLRVWQLAMDLVELVYGVTKHFPRSELYGLTSQIQRAAVSIPSNLAEGHTREHTKEFLHHISFAQGSLAELETQLEIALRLGFTTSEEVAPIIECASSLRKQQYALRNVLVKKLNS